MIDHSAADCMTQSLQTQLLHAHSGEKSAYYNSMFMVTFILLLNSKQQTSMASCYERHYSGTRHQETMTVNLSHFDSPLLYPAWQLD